MRPIYLLSQKPYEGAKNLPCIKIEYLDASCDLSGIDALIFSSKNGVLALNHLRSDWKDIPAYAIGSATATQVEALGGRVVYAAKSSYGDDFAREIKSQLLGKRALFCRPKVITSSLNSILKEAGVFLEECILYETLCENCEHLKTPPSDAIMIFSSPSTIECFFRCFTWHSSYQAVVIGEKTASFMPKDVTYEMASKPNIPACIECAEKLSKKAL